MATEESRFLRTPTRRSAPFPLRSSRCDQRQECNLVCLQAMWHEGAGPEVPEVRAPDGGLKRVIRQYAALAAAQSC